MFENNILTFNPGWMRRQPFRPFDDCAGGTEALKDKGITLEQRSDESTSGPAALC